MTNVLVLGASGFIGRLLTERLRQLGMDVTAGAATSRLNVVVDVSSESSVRAVLRGATWHAVVNLSGRGHSAFEGHVRSQDLTVHAEGPRVLAQAMADECPSAWLIHAASSVESDDDPPENSYAWAKQQGSHAVTSAMRRGEVRGKIATIFNTYGPSQPKGRFVSDCVDAIARGGAFRIDDPNRIRDFVYVDDVVSVLGDLVADPKLFPDFFEVGTGIGRRNIDVASEVVALLGEAAGSVVVPSNSTRTQGRAEVAAVEPGMPGYCATGLSEGLRRVIGNLP